MIHNHLWHQSFYNRSKDNAVKKQGHKHLLQGKSTERTRAGAYKVCYASLKIVPPAMVNNQYSFTTQIKAKQLPYVCKTEKEQLESYSACRNIN